MQTWAAEFDSVESFEKALDSARIPLGTVKSVATAAAEPWAVERGVLTDIDVNGEPRPVPKSPVRFAHAEVGPRRGAYLRGADNRLVLQDLLGMTDKILDELEANGVLLKETQPTD